MMRSSDLFSEALRCSVIRDRRVAHRKPYRWWEDPPKFNALAALIHDGESAGLLLQELAQHYPKAISEGRLHLWARAAHGIIDLLAEPMADEHRASSGRAAIPPSEDPTHG